MHKDIKTWLKATENQPTANEIEEKAAMAWYKSLSPEQQDIYRKLLKGSAGLMSLRFKLQMDVKLHKRKSVFSHAR